LLPAIDEAARATIAQVLLVVPPHTPDLQLLRTTFGNVSILTVVQQEPLGIGNALLMTKEHIGATEPFGVMLADEIDDTRTTMRRLLRAYDVALKPLVAVDTLGAKDNEAVLTYYGFARLGQQIQSHIFRVGSELVEKPSVRPSEDHYRIAGR
jgi:UTP--glucose-1-phosphate uridylyltransferase